MKPAPFEYVAPSTVAEAVGLLDELREEDVKLLAGGQSLVPMMNLRLARPTHLVDLNRVDELAGITVDHGGGEITVGALTRHADIEDSSVLSKRLPILPHVATHIGYRQIRYRGTFGGSCCHADPVAEWPMVTRLLDARFEVIGPGGRRTMTADEFYVSVFVPAVEPDEVLTGVRLPVPSAPWGWGFAEFARKVGDFAVVAAAAAVEAADGAVRRARLALAGAGPTPVRATAAEEGLVGVGIEDTDAFVQAARVAAEVVAPPTDLHGDSEFRRHLVEVEARRALLTAVGRLTSRP